MRLALATATAFQPAYRGDSARLTALVDHFRDRGWQVIVAHLHNPRQPLVDYDAMRRRCDELIVYRHDRPSVEAPGSERCDDWCPDSFAELVSRVCADRSADVLIAQFVFLSKCLAAVPPGLGVLKAIDADNVFSGRARLFEEAGVGYEWFSTNPNEEARALSRADLILAIQRTEQRELKRMAPRKPVLLVPHARPTVDCRRAASKDILFIGTRSR